MTFEEYNAEMRSLLEMSAIRQTNHAIAMIADLVHPNRIEEARRVA